MDIKEFREKDGRINVLESAVTYSLFRLEEVKGIEELKKPSKYASSYDVSYYKDAIEGYEVHWKDLEYDFDTAEEVMLFIEELSD